MPKVVSWSFLTFMFGRTADAKAIPDIPDTCPSPKVPVRRPKCFGNTMHAFSDRVDGIAPKAARRSGCNR